MSLLIYFFSLIHYLFWSPTPISFSFSFLSNRPLDTWATCMLIISMHGDAEASKDHHRSSPSLLQLAASTVRPHSHVIGAFVRHLHHIHDDLPHTEQNTKNTKAHPISLTHTLKNTSSHTPSPTGSAQHLPPTCTGATHTQPNHEFKRDLFVNNI